MIGLLGTVTGMIKAFATLGASGIGDPSGLSAAIGEVLVATASGLVIAIPAFGAFYFLRNRAADVDPSHPGHRSTASSARCLTNRWRACISAMTSSMPRRRTGWSAGRRAADRPHPDRRSRQRTQANEMAGGGGGRNGEPEFQVAPMIDVLLTILVFFMTITSAQVLKVDKTIQLPDREGCAEERQHARGGDRECALEVADEKKAAFVFDDRVYKARRDGRAAEDREGHRGEKSHRGRESDFPRSHPRRSRRARALCFAGDERLRRSGHHATFRFPR